MLFGLKLSDFVDHYQDHTLLAKMSFRGECRSLLAERSFVLHVPLQAAKWNASAELHVTPLHHTLPNGARGQS